MIVPPRPGHWRADESPRRTEGGTAAGEERKISGGVSREARPKRPEPLALALMDTNDQPEPMEMRHYCFWRHAVVIPKQPNRIPPVRRREP